MLTDAPIPAPRVTVVIPNYNHVGYLDKRIRSALDQIYQDFEVILLDDASTDNSRAIIERYRSHPKVAHIEYNAQNGGNPFKQWNKGVRLARGEYVWIAEADDFADATLLAALVPILDAHPNVGLAYCQSNLVDETGHITGSAVDWYWSPLPNRWRTDFINKGTDECARHLVHGCTLPNASAVVFRHNLYEKAGMADETLQYSADYLMWVRILLMSDLAFVARPLNYFRQHQTSVGSRMAKTQQALRERVRVLSEILDHATLLPPYDIMVTDAVGRARTERADLITTRDTLRGERDWLASERARLAKERDQLSWENQMLQARLDRIEQSFAYRLTRRLTKSFRRKSGI